MKAVVITGSRDWTDRKVIEAVLVGADLLIVGDCPTGADAIAREYARNSDIIISEHTANWPSEHAVAGPNRNARMAKFAALVASDGIPVECHAFPAGASRGTRGCMRLLAAAGLSVTMHEPAMAAIG